MDKNAPTLDRAKTPKVDSEIVWRFKDNKGWLTGFVRETMGQGRVVRITETRYSSDYGGWTVAVADIDWHLK